MSQKVPVKDLVIKVHDMERDDLGSMVISVSYIVGVDVQRTKIYVVADRKKIMKANPAYAVGLGMGDGSIPRGTMYEVTGVVTDRAYQMEGGKSGLSSKLTVETMTRIDDDDEEEDLFDRMPAKVYDKGSAANPLNVAKTINEQMNKIRNRDQEEYGESSTSRRPTSKVQGKRHRQASSVHTSPRTVNRMSASPTNNDAQDQDEEHSESSTSYRPSAKVLGKRPRQSSPVHISPRTVNRMSASPMNYDQVTSDEQDHYEEQYQDEEGEEDQPEHEVITAPKKRGRPKGSKNKL
ncbi:hypothetical protein BGX34_004830 [Mortierella sp. NVP85]|nr:hypothetical protein BGX34_004830 [Mortierella sp. NVP85]